MVGILQAVTKDVCGYVVGGFFIRDGRFCPTQYRGEWFSTFEIHGPMNFGNHRATILQTYCANYCISPLDDLYLTSVSPLDDQPLSHLLMTSI